MEPVAKRLYHEADGHVKYSGFVTGPSHPWFGYSPDGISYEERNNRFVLLEVKALDLGKRVVGDEFCKQCKYLEFSNDGVMRLKKKNKFYGQIQFGLGISNLPHAKLLLYVHKNRSVITVDVPRDEEFISSMFSVLTDVYFTHYLPFLSTHRNRLINA